MSSVQQSPGTSRSVERERVPPLNPTRLKVAGFVIGFFLVALAITFYFLHLSAAAVYTTGAVGGSFIIGMAIWTVIDCIKKSKKDAHDQELQKSSERLDWYNKAWAGHTEEIRRGIDEGRVTADLNTL